MVGLRDGLLAFLLGLLVLRLPALPRPAPLAAAVSLLAGWPLVFAGLWALLSGAAPRIPLALLAGGLALVGAGLWLEGGADPQAGDDDPGEGPDDDGPPGPPPLGPDAWAAFDRSRRRWEHESRLPLGS